MLSARPVDCKLEATSLGGNCFLMALALHLLKGKINWLMNAD